MTPRIFVDAPLAAGADVTLTDNQLHYLRNVLRLDHGAQLLLFNGQDGEWLAEIEAVSKKQANIHCLSLTKNQTVQEPLTLMCALIKPQRFELLIEKATELGVSNIQPLVTDHCHIRKMNTDRLTAHAIEASEQSERLSIPHIHDIKPLRDAVHNYEGNILFADESRDQNAILMDVLTTTKVNAILIGPEGGFSPAEKAYLYSRPNVRPVHLGSLILRAETAGIAMIAAVQVFSGAWR